MSVVSSRRRINEILAGTYTPDGISNWWSRKRSQLGGRSPAQAWQEGDHNAVAKLAEDIDTGAS